MRVTKKEMKASLILIVAFIVMYIVINVNDNILVHIVSIIIYSLIAMGIVKFDILHPYCWFSAFFCLYSIGYPILHVCGFSNVEYSKETMCYQLLGLFIALIVISPRKYLQAAKVDNPKLNIDIGVLNKALYVFLILTILFTALYAYRSGFSGKGEMYDEGGVILTMALRLPLILAMLYSVSSVSYYSANKRLPKGLILVTMIVLLIMTLFSGERDFLFRFLLITVEILYFFGTFKKKNLLLIIPVFVLLIPLSSTFKYYFLSGTVYKSTNGFIYSLLNGEFESAGRNLQVVLNNSSYTEGALGFLQIPRDIASVFVSSIDSPSSWFGKTFYPQSKTQYGFSLVGEGYVIGGIVGIVILFMIIGLIIKAMYRYSRKNLYTISAYFYFIAVVIYSIRADFGTILSALVKQIGLVIIIILILERFTKKSKINFKEHSLVE